MNKPKILAIYLPQYHITENNNRWWGDGFTDWYTVKEAIPYFEGHIQPRIPLNKDYYDLADVEVMKKQCKLANEYGVDGFVFYHYYFDVNDKELYKPVENYLNNKEINFSYCLNWVNESWVRTWSKVNGNVWGEKYDNSNCAQDTGVLKLQKYGGKEEWKQHFNYLLPFFKDDRYIKYDGRPVFIIYSPDSVPCLEEMIEYWNKLANENGLKELYLIGSNTNMCSPKMNGTMFNEPSYTMSKMRDEGLYTINNGVTCFDYDLYLEKVLKTKHIRGGDTFFTIASGYDTTPRRGKNGECFVNYSPECFKEGLRKLVVKSIAEDSKYVFIDAWNEWGEGMYLEPDEINGLSFLRAIKEIKEQYNKLQINKNDGYNELESLKSELADADQEINKLRAQNKLYSLWLTCIQNNIKVFSNYLLNNNFKTVAIYGYGDVGRLLHTQLINEGINVQYIVDRYVGMKENDSTRIYRIEEDLPKVNMIIITVFNSFAIKERLLNKDCGKVLDIWELVEKSL